MTVLQHEYDGVANKTHVRVQTKEFTDWFWIAGKMAAPAALACLAPIIEARLAEFHTGAADTPHEIETTSRAGLL